MLLKVKDFSDNGIPIIKIKNVNNQTVNFDDLDYFPKNKINIIEEKFFLKDNDILIAMTGQGSVGRVGRIKIENNKPYLLNQRVGKIIADEKNINQSYLYYVLSSSFYEKILFDRASGSGQPNLSPEIILKTEIPLPSYENQVKIGKLLDSLSEKISLNKKINNNSVL